MNIRHAVVCAVLAAAVSPLWAQGAASRPASSQPAAQSQPAQAQAAKVTVVSVAGPAQKLPPGAADAWADLVRGEQLDEMTIVRTGFRARVELAFADSARVVIEGPTKMGIAQFRSGAGASSTRLGLKYGTVQADVTPNAGADFRISTPVATLAVRGTIGKAGFAADSGMNIQGQGGVWNVNNGANSNNIGDGQQTNDDLTPPIVLANNSRQPIFGDLLGGLTLEEWQNLVNNGLGRGTFDGAPDPQGSQFGQGAGGSPYYYRDHYFVTGK